MIMKKLKDIEIYLFDEMKILAREFFPTSTIRNGSMALSMLRTSIRDEASKIFLATAKIRAAKSTDLSL